MTAAELATLRAVVREEVDRGVTAGITATLRDLGLFTDGDKEVTERRADFHYLRLRRKAEERFHDRVNRYVAPAVLLALVVTLVVQTGAAAWLTHLFR